MTIADGRAIALLLAAACILPCRAEPLEVKRVEALPAFSGWTAVTVGVEDLDAALELWVGAFGFDVARRADGPDEALAALWSLSPHDVARQALVRTRDHAYGMLHLVEFDAPDPPVRAGADVYDLLPKNLDIYVDDMPARVAALREKGYEFRTSNYAEVVAPDGTAFREIHMPGHDAINVVLLEVLGKQKPVTAAGFGGVGPLIHIVPDAGREQAFFRDVLLLDKLNHNVLEGPEIEKMIGLPPGTALDVSIWGHADQDLGGIEVIDYRGVDGENRYPLARPKSLGILHVVYVIGDASDLRRRLSERSIDVADHGRVDSLVADGDVISFRSPAGLAIYVYATGQ